MIMYKIVLAVYIDEKDTEKLMKLCEGNNFEFEDDRIKSHGDPDWQEFYRKETGFSGTIKRCYITNRTIDKDGINKIIEAIEKENDFDVMINVEYS